MKKIIVLGSINMDLVVKTDRAPNGGETLTGSVFQTIPGGKGANQAVAIARLGGNVEMIAKVGKDNFGDELVRELRKNHIAISNIKFDESESTGVALIIVEGTGENRIIVVPGANGNLSVSNAEESLDLLGQASYLVTQLEIPLDVVDFAISKANESGVKVVLNAAPYKPLSDELLTKLDYLIVNESEARSLTGKKVFDKTSARDAAKDLQARTNGVVIISLGKEGAVYTDGNGIWHVPAYKIKAVDTTAAGDAFVGGLVNALQGGKKLSEAIAIANAAGALAATRFGAQPSLPEKDELKNFLSKHNSLYEIEKL